MKRKNIILVIIFVVLGVIGYVLTRGLPWQQGKPRFFPKIEADSLTQIVINTFGTGEVRLEKEDSRWVVLSAENTPANQDRVDDVIRTTVELTREDLISTNPEKHVNLKVDGSGTRVMVYQGESLAADYYIGQVGPDFYSTYVRKEGEEQVYLVYRVLTSVVNPLEWRDLAVFDFNSNDVITVGVEYEGQVYKLEKKDDMWIISGDVRKVDSSKVQDFVYQLASLTADDLKMDVDAGKSGLDISNWRYAVTLSNGMIYELVIGSKDEEVGFYVLSSGSAITYLIPASTIDEFPKGVDTVSAD